MATPLTVISTDVGKRRELIQKALDPDVIVKISTARQQVLDKKVAAKRDFLTNLLNTDFEGTQVASALKAWKDQDQIFDQQVAALDTISSMLDELLTDLQKEAPDEFKVVAREQLRKILERLAQETSSSEKLKELKTKIESWLPEPQVPPSPPPYTKGKPPATTS